MDIWTLNRYLYLYLYELKLSILYVTVIFGLYANESLSHVQKEQMDALVLATEGQVPQELSDLFRDVSMGHRKRGRRRRIEEGE